MVRHGEEKSTLTVHERSCRQNRETVSPLPVWILDQRDIQSEAIMSFQIVNDPFRSISDHDTEVSDADAPEGIQDVGQDGSLAEGQKGLGTVLRLLPEAGAHARGDDDGFHNGSEVSLLL